MKEYRGSRAGQPAGQSFEKRGRLAEPGALAAHLVMSFADEVLLDTESMLETDPKLELWKISRLASSSGKEKGLPAMAPPLLFFFSASITGLTRTKTRMFPAN